MHNEEPNLEKLKETLIIDLKLADFYKTMKPFLASLQNNKTGTGVLKEGIDDLSANKARRPADPLIHLKVLAAYSAQHPSYEYFQVDQLSSQEDHGGSWMIIVTCTSANYPWNTMSDQIYIR